MNQQILDIIERESECKVTPETPLDALGMDSLEFMNLLLEIENETALKIPIDGLSSLNIVAVSDLIEALC